MLPSQVEILPPQPRLLRVPWLSLFAFAVAVALSLWLRPAISREQLFGDIAAKGLTIVAACALAAWLEHRVFAANAGYSGIRQFAVATALPLVSAVTAAAMIYGALRLGPRVRDDGTLLLAVGAWGLWLTNAALGSFIVVVVEVILRRLAPTFRARVNVAVLSLFVVQIGMGLLLYRYGHRLSELFPRALAHVRAFVALRAESTDDILGVLSVLTPTQKIVVAAVAFAVLVLLPAAMSTCAKFADAAMERVEPLVPAFEAIGEGRLEVLLDEGGSREFAAASRAFNGMVEKLEETRRLERSFSVYAGHSVMRRIHAQYVARLPVAATRDATVVYLEIRGLLSFSQVLAPERLFQFLNTYFDSVAAIVDRYEGYLDKFVGDAVIIVFNAPADQMDHQQRATRCAIDLQKEVATMNRAGAFAEIGQLSIAVGVATGPVISGILGGMRGAQYAALGDTVSLASKLAGITPPQQVWVNQATAEGLPRDLPTLLLASASVRGKQVPIVPYRVWPPP